MDGDLKFLVYDSLKRKYENVKKEEAKRSEKYEGKGSLAGTSHAQSLVRKRRGCYRESRAQQAFGRHPEDLPQALRPTSSLTVSPFSSALKRASP